MSLQSLARVYLGRNRPDGTIVSMAEFEDFVRESVAPLSPSGFTLFPAIGGWRKQDGTVETESTMVLEIIGASGATVLGIAKAYRERFGQEAVLASMAAVDSVLVTADMDQRQVARFVQPVPRIGG